MQKNKKSTPDKGTPTNKPVGTLYRLSPSAYTDLERQLALSLHVSHQTTEIQAGYMLGVQAVLSLVRSGFTVDA